jgi:predicted SnoaL-like aldol condensation-catalyzing enzyme
MDRRLLRWDCEFMRAPTLVVLGLVLGLAAAGPALAQGCVSSPEANKQLVLDFYRLGLVELQPRTAFESFVSPEFVEHKPDVPGGTREATIAFLEGLIAEVPEPRWEILRSVADDDLVFIHARFSPAPGVGHYALADLFRVENCRIVEHWDVVAPPVTDGVNPNPRF